MPLHICQALFGQALLPLAVGYVCQVLTKVRRVRIFSRFPCGEQPPGQLIHQVGDTNKLIGKLPKTSKDHLDLQKRGGGLLKPTTHSICEVPKETLLSFESFG